MVYYISEKIKNDCRDSDAYTDKDHKNKGIISKTSIPKLQTSDHNITCDNQQCNNTIEVERETCNENNQNPTQDPIQNIQSADHPTKIQPHGYLQQQNVDFNNSVIVENILRFTITKIKTKHKEFLEIYPFVWLEENKMETYLYIKMSKYDLLRGKELNEFIELCKEIYSLNLMEYEHHSLKRGRDSNLLYLKRLNQQEKDYNALCNILEKSALNNSEKIGLMCKTQSYLSVRFDKSINSTVQCPNINLCSKVITSPITYETPKPGAAGGWGQVGPVPHPNLSMFHLKCGINVSVPLLR